MHDLRDTLPNGFLLSTRGDRHPQVLAAQEVLALLDLEGSEQVFEKLLQPEHSPRA